MLNNKVLLSSTMICGGLLSALSLNSTNAKADIINSTSSSSNTQSSDVISSSTTTSNSLKDKSNNNDTNTNIDKSNTNISSNSLNDSQKNNELNKNSNLQVNSTSENNNSQNTNSNIKTNNNNLSSNSSSDVANTYKSNDVTNQSSNEQKLHNANLSFAAVQDNSNNQEKSIKDIYDGQPIPIDSNGRVRTDWHNNTDAETERAWKGINYNGNLKPYKYDKLQPEDKAAYDQYMKDRNAYNKVLLDGKSHLDEYKKVLDEYDKLTDRGDKYSEDVVIGPPCWWHGYNGWQSKENIKNVWISSVAFVSDTPDENGSYNDVAPMFLMRHNAITGQTTFQSQFGGKYIGLPDGTSHCSNYIDKSGVITVVPPKGYKFNVKESYEIEPYLTFEYNGKKMLRELTPDKAVFDFQVYADAGRQYIGTMVTPIEGHPGYYKMDNNHMFQLAVTPIGKQPGDLNLDPENKKTQYKETIDWGAYISPTLTSNYGLGDRKAGMVTRSQFVFDDKGQNPKKMSDAEREYVVVAPAGWQFQNFRPSEGHVPNWAQYEYNDVHDTYDRDWKKGDKLVRAAIDDGTTNTPFATPDQNHIGFFDFNRKFMGFNDEPTLGGTAHGGYDRVWIVPDQTWKGLPGQKKDQVFIKRVADTGASIDAKDMTVKLGDKTDFSKVNATDWMGKPTTAKLVKGSVNVNKPGKYSLTYENTNSFGIKSDKTVLITVQGNQQNNNKPTTTTNNQNSNKVSSNQSNSNKPITNSQNSSNKQNATSPEVGSVTDTPIHKNNTSNKVVNNSSKGNDNKVNESISANNNSSKVSTSDEANKDNSSKVAINDRTNKDDSSKLSTNDKTNKDNSSKLSTNDETNKDNSSKTNLQDGIAGDVNAKKLSATNKDEVDNTKENSVTGDSDLNSKDNSSKINSTTNSGININSTNNQSQDVSSNNSQSKDALINSAQSKISSSNNSQSKDALINSAQSKISSSNNGQSILFKDAQSEVTKNDLSSQAGSSSNSNEDLPQSGDSKDEMIITALLTLGLIGMTKFNKRKE